MNLMAGAVYALYQAAELDYDDNRANPKPDASKQEFRRSVVNISQRLSPEDAVNGLEVLCKRLEDSLGKGRA